MKFAPIGLFVLLAATVTVPAADRGQLANIPVYFEANQGQAEPSVRFLSRGPGYSFYLTSKQAVSVLADGSVVRMKWVGGSSKSRVTGLNPLPGKSNYLVGKDARRWRTDIEQFARVRYEAVYPGIDLIFYGSGGRLEYDLMVAPGANLSQVRFAFEGIDKLRTGDDGSLLVGQMRQERPHSYQESNGKRQIISSRFVLIGKRQVGFEVGAYDPSLPLVIDPKLGYSYKIAASGNDRPFGVAVDAAGNLYVTGWTNSPDFPIQGAFQGTYKGGFDAFVIKLNAAGDALVYATFLGGANRDYGEAITVDGGGNAIVFGVTDSTDFPTLNALQPTKKGRDTFITKLNAAGNGLIFSTYFGGSESENPGAIGTDPAGNLYVAGQTPSSDFPVTAAAFQRTYRLNGDGFISKLDASGQTLVYSSYLGGGDRDGILALAVDPAGSVCVTGFTDSSNFPLTTPLQGTSGGGTDAFLARVNASGSALVFSTYLGGSGVDRGTGVAIDAAGNMYLAGSTDSPNFPTRNALQPDHKGGGDAFVSKFNTSGSALVYSTYLGGSGFDREPALAVNRSGSAFVFGSTQSSDFPLKDPLRESGTGRECFLSRINPAGSGLTFSTYYGSDGEDIAEGMAIAAASASSSLRWTSVGDTQPHQEEDEERNFLWLIFTSYPGGSNTNSSDTNAGKVDTPTDPPPPPKVTTSIGQNDAGVKDPVSTAGGEFYDEILDIHLRALLPFHFSRFYSSGLAAEGQARSALGTNWMHNYDLRMEASASSAKVVFERGHSVSFTRKDGVWESTNAHPWNYQLLQSGSQFRFFDSFGHLIHTFNADAGGRLEKIQDQNGNALTLAYTADLLSRVSDGLGRSLDFTYTGGKLTRVQDHSGRSVSFTYSGDDLASATDVVGGVTEYSYTTVGSRVGLMVSATRPRGNKAFEQVYDASSRVVSQKDGVGNTTSIAYDTPAAGVNSVTDAVGGKAGYRHENGRNLVEHSDEAGNSTATTYDAYNRRSSVKDQSGNTTLYSYHAASGMIQSLTDPNGARTSFTYTERTLDGFKVYDLVRVTYPDGASERFEYDAAGNLTARVDEAGQRWQYTRNARGQLLTLTVPSGGLIRFVYNADGTEASFETSSSGITRFTYDDLKRVTQVADPSGAIRRFEYNAIDQMTRLVDQAGAATSVGYDANHQLASWLDPAGRTIRFDYSPADELVRVTDPLGSAVALTYDALSRPRSVTAPDGAVATAGYDSRGNLVSYSDGEGKIWKWEFDKQGAVVGYINPLGQKTTLVRDALGRVTSVVTAGGNEVRLTYDAMHRLVSLRDAAGDTSQFTYDARGHLKSITLPGDIAVGYSRNALGQITAVTDSNGKIWSYAYDPFGRLSSSTDPLGNQQSYRRDSNGRITQVDFPNGSLNLTLDQLGRVRRRSYSDGTTLEYSYDSRGLMTAGTSAQFQYDARGDLVGSNGLAIERDSARRISKISFAAGKDVIYRYDRRGLPIEVRDWLGGITTIGYDDAGRLNRIARPNGWTTNFTFDAEGSVTRVEDSRSGVSYQNALVRDRKGQIVQATRSVPLTPTPDQLAVLGGSQVFDAASQVVGLAYDSLGRRTSDARRTYTWNLDSRLTGYNEAGQTTQFAHDARGLIVTQTRAGSTRHFVWNYALALPSISAVREGGSDLRYYVHLPNGDLLYSIDATGTLRRFYHHDETGSAIFLSNDAGAVTDSYAYSPYGRLVASTGTSDNPFTFAARYGVLALGPTGLYAARVRIYDSVTQAFLSRDPVTVALPKLVNPYQWAYGNPLQFVDASGEDVISVGLDIIDFGGDVAEGFSGYFGGLAEGLRWTSAQIHNYQWNWGPNSSVKNHWYDFREQKAAQLAARSQTLATVGKVGEVASVAGVALSGVQLQSELSGARTGYQAAVDSAIAVHGARRQELKDLKKQGKISWIQYRQMSMQINHQLDWAIHNAEFATDNDMGQALIDWNLGLAISRLPFVPGPVGSWIVNKLAPKKPIWSFVDWGK